MGIVFAMFGGFIYWFPLFTGLGLNEFYGKAHFYLTFIGVNLTFIPQHFLGLAGIPRRYSDYPDCFYVWNKVSSLGSFITIIRVLVFVFILWEAFSSHRVVIWTFNSNVHLEWTPRLPIKFHSHRESIKIFY
jgi:cytochrome c oxidase subunit 1